MSSELLTTAVDPLAEPGEKTILDVRNLQTVFKTDDGLARAVDGVSFDLRERETLAIVGESGCGKSVTAFSILRLVGNPGKVVGGSVEFRGTDLLKLKESEMRRIRGKHISMIFQEPMTSLNPVFTIGRQIMEPLEVHEKLSEEAIERRAVEMLKLVGIPEAENRLGDYPHQFSGGMRQRVMIAMSLMCRPDILIADEPTTALDVTIQAQILRLLRRLQREMGMSVILITHDLGVVAENSHRVAVMYAGRIVEQATAADLFKVPLHPYTIGLFESLPSMHGKGERLRTIPGSVPNPVMMPSGCPFHPRCPLADQYCVQNTPELVELRPEHWVSCWKAKRDGTMPVRRSQPQVVDLSVDVKEQA